MAYSVIRASVFHSVIIDARCDRTVTDGAVLLIVFSISRVVVRNRLGLIASV